MAYFICLNCKESREITFCADCSTWMRIHIPHKVIIDNNLTWLTRWKSDISVMEDRLEVG